MTTTTTVRRLYDDYLNNPTAPERFAEIIGPDYVSPQGGRGPAAFAQTLQALRVGFPDIHYEVDEIVAQDNHVAVRFVWRGTHAGPFRTFAPTNRRVESSGTGFFEVHDGKIVAGKIDTDRLGFLLAIGAIPPDAPFLPPPK